MTTKMQNEVTRFLSDSDLGETEEDGYGLRDIENGHVSRQGDDEPVQWLQKESFHIYTK